MIEDHPSPRDQVTEQQNLVTSVDAVIAYIERLLRDNPAPSVHQSATHRTLEYLRDKRARLMEQLERDVALGTRIAILVGEPGGDPERLCALGVAARRAVAEEVQAL